MGTVTWERFLQVLDEECLAEIVETLAKSMVDEYLKLRDLTEEASISENTDAERTSPDTEAVPRDESTTNAVQDESIHSEAVSPMGQTEGCLMPLLTTCQDQSKQLSGGQSFRAQICNDSTETGLQDENALSEDASLNNRTAIYDEPMMASGQADESGSHITGTVAGAGSILVESIQAANVSLSGETVSGDTMRAYGQAESALSEAANYFARTEVAPAPVVVANVHAENVTQESEPTVGPVPKIAENVYLRDASQSVEAADGVMPISARNPTPLGGSTVEDTTVASVTADNMQ
jgi:hypothetical protein